MTPRPLIVFDLDGTLVDSQRDLAAAANALIVERGGQPQDEAAIARMIGEGAALLVKRALTAAGLELDAGSLPRFLELYDERLLETTVAYPGIPDALRLLSSRGPVAVLTNKPLEHTRRILKGLELAHFFDHVLGGDGPLRRKPDPAGLRHLMNVHRAEPRATVLVGDSPVDAATAASAGAAFCLARYGFGARKFEAGVVPAAGVETPADIPAAISRLLSR